MRFGGYIPGLHQILFAIILMLIVLFKPGGIGEWLDSLWHRITARRGMEVA